MQEGLPEEVTPEDSGRIWEDSTHHSSEEGMGQRAEGPVGMLVYLKRREVVGDGVWTHISRCRGDGKRSRQH